MLIKASFGLLVGLLFLYQVLGIDVEKELTLTHKEMQALDKFKGQVAYLLTEDYMKSDLYLLRWLRAKNLDLRAAQEMLIANINWRKENRMDEILTEDWSRFASKYPIDDTGTDYQGRPVLACDISEWDVREAVLAGHGEALLRFMFRSLESVSKRVRDLQGQGQNVTQWNVLLNLDNFNLQIHGCLHGCLPIYVRFITAHENYYPYGADKIIAINTPGIFEVVLQLVRPVMSAAMKDSLMVIGTNKNEWRKVILDRISPDQLPRHFGGTKILNY